MQKMVEWCRGRHPRVARWLMGIYALALVLAIFVGGYATGSLVAWSDAGHAIAQLREDYRQSLAALAGQVGMAAGDLQGVVDDVRGAATAAEQAAKTAGSAGAQARSAASTAKAAAGLASEAARKIDEAVAPPAPAAEVPAWLDTP